MRFTLEERDNLVIFSLKNTNIDGKVASEFKAKLLILAQPTIEGLIIDLTQTMAMDSSGLGALLLAHRQLKEQSVPVVLVGVQDFVKSLMSMTRIDELFEFYPTVEEAIATFKEN